MRHILGVLTLGAALALSAPAAFAYGDNVDYPGPGLRQNVTVADTQSQVSSETGSAESTVGAGPSAPQPWWVEFHDQNTKQ
jgi:hypothetical protein